jgi:hypothetical protein
VALAKEEEFVAVKMDGMIAITWSGLIDVDQNIPHLWN